MKPWQPARFGEHVCEHGVGHPSLDRAFSIAKHQLIRDPITKELCERQIAVCTIHGCDGCCSRDDFPGKYTKDEYDQKVLELMEFYEKRDKKPHG